MRWFPESCFHKSSIAYLLFGFIREFFGFFNKKYWLFWHFLYNMIHKQISVWRRSKKAANLLKKIQDSCQQDSLNHLLIRLLVMNMTTLKK
jgi:hypothetical protein